MLSQLRASFQPKSEQPNQPQSIINSTSIDHHPDQNLHLSPSSLSQNLSPSSINTYSSLNPISPSSSTHHPINSNHYSSKPPLIPAEILIIVRPPPGKQNHPLNLQIQLILPNLINPSREPSLSTPTTTTLNSSPTHQIFTTTPLTTAPESINSHDHSLKLNRTQSIKSSHSTQSNRSNRTSSSGGEGRNRRVTPLYNLQWHTVLPTWISDAGTDAKVAKFAKRGIELIELANIEPNEIRSGRYASDLNLLLSGLPISPPATATSFLSTPGTTPNPSLHTKQDRPGPAALFNKVKRMNVFNKKSAPKLDSGSPPNSIGKKFPGIITPTHYSNHNDLPSTNAGLSSVGPTIEAGGRRAEGYVWIVRKWMKPEIVDWQNSSPKTNQLNPVFIEWRKAKKRSRGPLSRSKTDTEQASTESSLPPAPVSAPIPTPVEPEPAPPPPIEPILPAPPPLAPDSALKLFTIPAATTMGVMNFFGRLTKAVESIDPSPRTSVEQASLNTNEPRSSEPTTSIDSHTQDSRSSEVTEEEADDNESVVQSSPASISESPDEEEEEADSDPEDSESPWHCEVVVQANGGHQQRFFVASLTPHPHHPKLVAQLALPWNLEPIPLYPLSTPSHPLPLDDQDSHLESFSLLAEEVKDLVAVSCMWLVVKERLGGVGKRRKGDRAWRI